MGNDRYKEIQLYEGDEPFIFVSYKHDDPAYDDEIYRILSELSGQGYRIWFDRALHLGDVWEEELSDHLARCHVLLAMISNSYFDSMYSRVELKSALEMEKTIFPLWWEELRQDINRKYSLTVRALKETQFVPGSEWRQLYDREAFAVCRADRSGGPESREEAPGPGADGSIRVRVPVKDSGPLEPEVALHTEEPDQKKRFGGLTYSKEAAERIMGENVDRVRELRADLTDLLARDGVDARPAYRTAKTVVTVVEEQVGYYPFWNYEANQAIHLFKRENDVFLRQLRDAGEKNKPLSDGLRRSLEIFAGRFDEVVRSMEKCLGAS